MLLSVDWPEYHAIITLGIYMNMKGICNRYSYAITIDEGGIVKMYKKEKNTLDQQCNKNIYKTGKMTAIAEASNTFI